MPTEKEVCDALRDVNKGLNELIDGLVHKIGELTLRLIVLENLRFRGRKKSVRPGDVLLGDGIK